MTKEYYLLKSCKELRNSSAHNNCLLDDLHTNNRNHYTHPYVSKELSKLKSVSKKVRYKKMSNFRTQQIVTLLYTHKRIVTSTGVQNKSKQLIKDFIGRINNNRNYYSSNSLISTSFDFLTKIVDFWF